MYCQSQIQADGGSSPAPQASRHDDILAASINPYSEATRLSGLDAILILPAALLTHL